MVWVPTESALVVAAYKAWLNPVEHPHAVSEFSFDSIRKRMTIIEHATEGLVAHTKGAPEVIIDLCTQILDGDEILRLQVAQFHVGHEHRIGAVQVKPDVKARKRLQPFQRLITLRLCLPGGKQILQMIAHQVEQQRLLVRCVQIQRPRLHADRSRDLAHRNSGKAMPREQLQRRLANPGSGDLGM